MKIMIEASPEQAEALELDIAWIVCFYGKDHAAIDGMIAKVEGHKNPNSGMIACLKGWRALSKNDHQGARKAFLPYKDSLPFARLGLAQIDQDNEDNEAYWAGLNVALSMDQSGLSALTAMSRLSGDKQTVEMTELGKVYDKMFAELPLIVRMPTSVKGKKIAVSMKASSSRYQFLEPNAAVVKIRNNLAIPMSFGGDDGVLSSQLLVYVGLAGARPVNVVSNVGRRLVLNAFDSIEVSVPLDWNTMGRAGIARAGQMFEYSAECVYSPVIGANGRPMAGPMGGRALIRLIAKSKILPTEPNIKMMVNNIGSHDELTQYRALAWLGRVLPQNTLQEDLDPDDENLAVKEVYYASLASAGKKFLSVYERLDDDGKAWVAATILIRKEGEISYLQGVYDAMGNHDSLYPNLTYMLMQMIPVDHPVVNRSLRSDDAELVKTAGWVQKILEVRAEAALKRQELIDEAKAKREAAGE